MFEIQLSTIFTSDDMAAAFSRLIPNGLKIDVFSRLDTPGEDTPEEVGAIWACLKESNDPDWPCMVDVIYGDECDLGEYPDLRVAEYLHKCFGCNILCTIYYPFMGDLDPQDPYWALAYVNGQWYFADTSDTAFMGPSICLGGEEIPGTEEVQLIRPITVPNIWAK